VSIAANILDEKWHQKILIVATKNNIVFNCENSICSHMHTFHLKARRQPPSQLFSCARRWWLFRSCHELCERIKRSSGRLARLQRSEMVWI